MALISSDPIFEDLKAEDQFLLQFGNTYFEVVFNGTQWKWNFLPFGEITPPEETDGAERSLRRKMFNYGFYQLIKSIKNKKLGADEFEILDRHPIEMLFNTTNLVMCKFLQGQFGPEAIKYTPSVKVNGEYDCFINLQLILKKESVMEMLEKNASYIQAHLNDFEINNDK